MTALPAVVAEILAMSALLRIDRGDPATAKLWVRHKPVNRDETDCGGAGPTE